MNGRLSQWPSAGAASSRTAGRSCAGLPDRNSGGSVRYLRDVQDNQPVRGVRPARVRQVSPSAVPRAWTGGVR